VTGAEPGGGPRADTGDSAVPPYEGRRESADVDEGGTYRDGANVGGAAGPRTSDGLSSPEPSETPRGAVASPSDETPAAENSGEGEQDPGVGPGHVSGAGRGEDKA